MALCMKATRAVAVRPARASVKAQASLHNVAKAVGVSIASLGLTLGAQAAVIKMGADDGALAFVPAEVTIAAGDSVTFSNNVAGPHNVIFSSGPVSEDDLDELSIEDNVTTPGAENVVGPFNVAGTYGYYCQPHKAAGMAGTIIVK